MWEGFLKRATLLPLSLTLTCQGACSLCTCPGGGGGSEGSKGGTPHWVEWLKTGMDVSINLAAWRPEVGVTIESLKSGNVPSSSLQTFKCALSRPLSSDQSGPLEPLAPEVRV